MFLGTYGKKMEKLIDSNKHPSVFEKSSVNESQISVSFEQQGEVAALESGADEGHYHEKIRHHFSIGSLLGLGFTLTSSWSSISSALVTGISSGGPMLIVYGLLIVTFFACCIGVTLSELVSAFPENSGGQYYWTVRLAPAKSKRFWAYMSGSYAWFCSLFTSASLTLTGASAIVGMYVLSTGDSNKSAETWQVFVCYELLNLFLTVFNIYEAVLPLVSTYSLYISLLSSIVITITVLVCSRGHYQSPRFVFATFENSTGWTNSGLAFIVGLINPTWSLSGLDCTTHLAEEILEPEKYIPIAIMSTIAIGFFTAFTYSIAMFFSIRNLDTIINSNTGVPMLDIFYQALQNRAGAIVLECLILLTILGCIVACHTWQARLCWTFARDSGIWGSRYWSKVNKRTGLPVNAHLMSCVWSAVIGCTYMGSATAFNAMVTSCLVFLATSYSIPIVFLLYKGRSNIKHGPFWLGRWGLIANVMTLCWSVFQAIFFSFPFTMPAETGTMNYSCVVLAGMTLYAVGYWFLRGRKHFALSQEEDRSIQESGGFELEHLGGNSSMKLRAT